MMRAEMEEWRVEIGDWRESMIYVVQPLRDKIYHSFPNCTAKIKMENGKPEDWLSTLHSTLSILDSPLHTLHSGLKDVKKDHNVMTKASRDNEQVKQLVEADDMA